MATQDPIPGTTGIPIFRIKSKVCVNQAGECIGNGLSTGEDVDAGSLLFSIRRPLVGSLETERLKDTCANCYVWAEGSNIGSRLYVPEDTKVQTCAGCRRFRYCSKACQKEAWHRGHKHECKNMKKIMDRELPKAVQATMEILILRKHGLFEDEEWEKLLKLHTHIYDFKKTPHYEMIQLMAMGTWNYSWTQEMFTLDFVEAMYARVLTNSLTLVTPTYDPLGIILDPRLGSINHSCDPNAYVVMDGPEIAVRTLKPIKMDEEIFISYIDNTMPYARRQSELKGRWFFSCRCSKCEKGATLREDEWAADSQSLMPKWKAIANTTVEKEDFASDPANYVGESQDDKTIAAIQGRVFAEYEAEQRIADSTEAIKAIEDGMRLCYQTGIWPVFRQPYAAFRDDLIVHMLSIGNFKTAWAHCAKRYRYILPELYPQKFHPIRVIQTWQMAMLALYLSEEGLEPGADMGIIAYMLVLEVDQLAKLSHGEKTMFSMSVRNKYQEMAAELQSKLGPDFDNLIASLIPRQRQLLMDMGAWIQY